jgi:hypothetical protein
VWRGQGGGGRFRLGLLLHHLPISLRTNVRLCRVLARTKPTTSPVTSPAPLPHMTSHLACVTGASSALTLCHAVQVMLLNMLLNEIVRRVVGDVGDEARHELVGVLGH